LKGNAGFGRSISTVEDSMKVIVGKSIRTIN
jgi:hypothetical protein